MPNSALLYIGSVVIILWGIAHLIPTKSIIAGFNNISDDNMYIITMEWIAEGLAIIFAGMVVLVPLILYGADNSVVLTISTVSAVMLVVMAVLSLFTGYRTSIIPMKICPFVKTFVAVLFLLGSLF